MRSLDPLPPKKDVARALLLRGSVFVHLDPRVEGTAVPSWLGKQPQLVLQIGLDLPVPIPDLRVDDAGVYGTLSFNRAPFPCSVPWDAVFALVGDDGRGMLWPESVPAEIVAEIDREAGRRPPPEPAGARSEAGAAVVPLEAYRGGARPSGGRAGAAGVEPEAGAWAAPDEGDVETPSSPGPQGNQQGPAGRGHTRRGRPLPPYLKVVK